MESLGLRLEEEPATCRRFFLSVLQDLAVLQDHETIKQLGHILKTNVRACTAVGHPFVTQVRMCVGVCMGVWVWTRMAQSLHCANACIFVHSLAEFTWTC